MDRQKLYDSITQRKIKPKDFEPYAGGNGRVDKCVELFRCGKLRGGDLLLDVGGAIGDLGYAVSDLFANRITLDISREILKAAEKKGNEIMWDDVDQNGFQFLTDECVSTVTALDFIEHIIDPENFARECSRVLKKFGQVFVNTPNIRFWKHIRELFLDGTFPHTSGDREVFHGGHLAFYTFKDLCMIFGQAGFGKFEMVMDEEGYVSPPDGMIEDIGPRNQSEYLQLSKELGCPNLLFIAEKP